MFHMAEVQEQPGEPYELFANVSVRIRDLEEKQNINRDRLLLIGKNFLETKEGTNKKIIEVKRDVESMKRDIKKIKSFLESISNEITKFAKKEDLEILSKQAKMFQPLNLTKKSK